MVPPFTLTAAERDSWPCVSMNSFLSSCAIPTGAIVKIKTTGSSFHIFIVSIAMSLQYSGTPMFLNRTARRLLGSRAERRE